MRRPLRVRLRALANTVEPHAWGLLLLGAAVAAEILLILRG